jgi:hypothetical protein
LIRSTFYLLALLFLNPDFKVYKRKSTTSEYDEIWCASVTKCHDRKYSRNLALTKRNFVKFCGTKLRRPPYRPRDNAKLDFTKMKRLRLPHQDCFIVYWTGGFVFEFCPRELSAGFVRQKREKKVPSFIKEKVASSSAGKVNFFTALLMSSCIC